MSLYLRRQCKRDIVHHVLSPQYICSAVTNLWVKVSAQWTQGGNNFSNSRRPLPSCHCLPRKLRHWKLILLLVYGTSWYSRSSPMIYLQFCDQLSSAVISLCLIWQCLLFSIQSDSSVFEKGFRGNIKLMERTSFLIILGQKWWISIPGFPTSFIFFLPGPPLWDLI